MPPQHPGPSPVDFPPSHSQTDLLRSRLLCFIPATQPCCASVVESSFVQSALLISYMLSDLLESADIYPHICIMARAPPAPPPIDVVVFVVVEGGWCVSRTRVLVSLSLSLFSQPSCITWHSQFVCTARFPRSLDPALLGRLTP